MSLWDQSVFLCKGAKNHIAVKLFLDKTYSGQLRVNENYKLCKYNISFQYSWWWINGNDNKFVKLDKYNNKTSDSMLHDNLVHTEPLCSPFFKRWIGTGWFDTLSKSPRFLEIFTKQIKMADNLQQSRVKPAGARVNVWATCHYKKLTEWSWGQGWKTWDGLFFVSLVPFLSEPCIHTTIKPFVVVIKWTINLALSLR